jgi:hypothetical protein
MAATTCSTRAGCRSPFGRSGTAERPATRAAFTRAG